ncbi:MAG: bifunctional 5,10-methylene-tetrahydrofolate dehydrogenase/5,10-methylene-tetrahydrofolate cyclohydrolase [Coriobacteriia bacterium]|nr:bifunctional 5,10-methylene-tetrahydrofolate dehydrogenase/5,10-methylene-tetrahydrofolate cyclohydrolase [Coriobacteriia bacterium]
MTQILRGTEVAGALGKRTAEKIEALVALGVTPALATLRVGGRGDDIAYERGISRRAEGLGVRVRNLVLPEEVSQEGLQQEIKALNVDPEIHGILLFNPLPAHLDSQAAAELLAVEKDIDGICMLSHAGVYTDKDRGYPPCTASACLEVLDHYGIELAGRHAVVIGRSLVVGKPLAMMLLRRNVTVTVCHSHTRKLKDLVKAADIVIACAGQAKMVDASYLTEGQTIIDVGINVAEDGSLVGDVDYEAALDKVAAITPVPGGIGAVTTMVLLGNVVDSALKATAVL